MLSSIFKQGIVVSASKPIGVLNKLANSGAMLAWYQDKLAEVLNMHAGSGAISGKRDLVNAPLGRWFKIKICLDLLFMM